MNFPLFVFFTFKMVSKIHPVLSTSHSSREPLPFQPWKMEDTVGCGYLWKLVNRSVDLYHSDVSKHVQAE